MKKFIVDVEFVRYEHATVEVEIDDAEVDGGKDLYAVEEEALRKARASRDAGGLWREDHESYHVVHIRGGGLKGEE